MRPLHDTSKKNRYNNTTPRTREYVAMAWKNLKQRSLGDSMIIEHEALKELDAVNELIDWSRIEFLLKDIHAKKLGEKA